MFLMQKNLKLYLIGFFIRDIRQVIFDFTNNELGPKSKIMQDFRQKLKRQKREEKIKKKEKNKKRKKKEKNKKRKI